jgi:polysaccharide biosynthesis protein PslG
VTMVVAMTPRFYAAAPTDPPHRIGPYKAFVRALMKRYQSFHGSRGIDAYQVWNEGNISTFWTGTPGQLARLTRAMDQVRDHVDPKARVIGPAMVTRLSYELGGLEKFYAQKVGGVPVWRFMDAVSLSLYPVPRYGSHPGTPEDSMRLLAQARHRLHRDGVPRSEPVWNTEINYGLQSGSNGGKPARRISRGLQAAYVVRTYLLNAANGVKRVFWYRYDMHRVCSGCGTLGNTLLTDPDNTSRVTPAGRAYARAQDWMHGRLIGPPGTRPCQKNRHGTYMCVVKDPGGIRRIYWNPYGTGRVRLVKGVHHLQGVLGKVSTVSGSTITVGGRPVMAYR